MTTNISTRDEEPMLPHGAKVKKAHVWQRDGHDFYLEPKWCSARLFESETIAGTVYDPACGLGRIVESAAHYGHTAFGTDIVKRSANCSYTADFLAPNPFDPNDVDNIVTNPPFKHSKAFITRALEIIAVGHKAIFLLPMSWLVADRRSRWLAQQPLKKVYALTPRPSMPPGEAVLAGAKIRGGRMDFGWYVFEPGYRSAPKIAWIRRDP